MIKCGKLKGKDDKVADQCILYARDGSKALGYFLYSKYGGQKGAKAAAHKREGQVQAFKKKHQGLLDAVEAFGAPVVLKYLLDADCPDCEKVVKAHVAAWLEKARGEGQGVGGERQGDGGADQCVCPKCGATAKHEKGVPCNEQKCPKCGAAMTGQDAEKSVNENTEEMEGVEKAKTAPKRVDTTEDYIRLRIKEPGQFQAGSFRTIDIDAKQGIKAVVGRLKGQQTTTTQAFLFSREKKWTSKKARQWLGKQGERRKAKKSFGETIEEALTLLEKHEDEEMELNDIDLSKLEAWLSGEEAADVEPESIEDAEPEPESDAEPEPTPEPEPELVEEQPLDFHTFLLREHAQRRADILAALGEEVENE